MLNNPEKRTFSPLNKESRQIVVPRVAMIGYVELYEGDADSLYRRCPFYRRTLRVQKTMAAEDLRRVRQNAALVLCTD
jgi:hypothetical protein